MNKQEAWNKAAERDMEFVERDGKYNAVSEGMLWLYEYQGWKLVDEFYA